MGRADRRYPAGRVAAVSGRLGFREGAVLMIRTLLPHLAATAFAFGTPFVFALIGWSISA
jgi:hypothetical protein